MREDLSSDKSIIEGQELTVEEFSLPSHRTFRVYQDISSPISGQVQHSKLSDSRIKYSNFALMKTVKVRKSSEDSNEGVVDTNSDEEGGAEKVLSSSIAMSRC